MSDLDDKYNVTLCTLLFGLTSRSEFATASKPDSKRNLTPRSACWAHSKSVKGSHPTSQNSLTSGNCKCVNTVCSFVVTSINTVSLLTNVYYLISASVCVKLVRYDFSILLCHNISNNYKYNYGWHITITIQDSVYSLSECL